VALGVAALGARAVRATEQAAAGEEVSSSMEQMGANIRQNNDNALQTEKISIKASEDAREAGKAVTETVAAMKDIAGKISIIEEIARQTNPGAERRHRAARGEHGGACGGGKRGAEARRRGARRLRGDSQLRPPAAIAEKAGILARLPTSRRRRSWYRDSAASGRTGAEQINKAIMQLDQ
jgi:methyl-accepting chemotaxis protein